MSDDETRPTDPEAPAPPAAPAPPTAQPAYAAPYPTYAARPRFADQVLGMRAVVAVAIACLLIGGLSGAVLGRASGGHGDRFGGPGGMFQQHGGFPDGGPQQRFGQGGGR
jgi:hypothetical protein